MKAHLIVALYMLVGLINFTPLSGVLGHDRLLQLYGVGPLDPDLALLMRHRAVLLGIVGSLLMAAAWYAPWRLAATIAGLVSMLSYIFIVWVSETDNFLLVRIMWIDVGAGLLLLAAFALHAAST
ncbi:MAG: phosphopantetheine adenylyltransferase [Pseudomonadota bacterium]